MEDKNIKKHELLEPPCEYILQKEKAEKYVSRGLGWSTKPRMEKIDNHAK